MASKYFFSKSWFNISIEKVTLFTEPQNTTDPKVDKNVLGYQNFTIVKLPKNNFANFIGLFRAKLTILKFANFLR